MSVFFTSDTHFGHENVIGYCARPFKDAEEMDRELVRRWNETVRPFDDVYHLGDVSFRRAEETARILKRLNGRITVVKGNHDRQGYLRKWVEAGAILGWHQRYWTFEPFFLSHVPMSTEEPQLCGHVHVDWKQRRKTINVGVDQWDYRPVAYETLVGMIR